MIPLNIIDEVIEDIDNLLSTERQWVKRGEAFDQGGKRVPPRDKSAVCWCLYGAHLRVTDINRGVDAQDLWDAVNARFTATNPLNPGWPSRVAANDADAMTFAMMKDWIKRAREHR